MKFTKIYTTEDGHSCFMDMEATVESVQALGKCSSKYPVQNMLFREMKADGFLDWHTPAHEQYIVYLEGETEVTASNGETRIFRSGDVLLAADVTGKGHTSRVLKAGKTLVIVASSAN